MVKSRLLASVGIVAVVGGIAGGLAAQTPASPAFDVASIKERSNAPGGGIQRLATRLVAGCTTLGVLTRYAYSRTGSAPVSGLPGWANPPCGYSSLTNTYEFQATMPPDTTEAQVRQMMQTFLANRFKLAVHWETKTMPIYALVTGASGFKLKPADPKDEPVRATGSIGCPADDRGCRISALGTVSLSSLVLSVSRSIGRQVIDKTGLAGTYYFGDLIWAGDTSLDSPLPSLPTLLKEKFGLELKADTGPVDTLVIDHVEHPTED